MNWYRHSQQGSPRAFVQPETKQRSAVLAGFAVGGAGLVVALQDLNLGLRQCRTALAVEMHRLHLAAAQGEQLKDPAFVNHVDAAAFTGCRDNAGLFFLAQLGELDGDSRSLQRPCQDQPEPITSPWLLSPELTGTMRPPASATPDSSCFERTTAGSDGWVAYHRPAGLW